MEVKLYVGNLSYATQEDELRTLFAQAGTVTSVAVIKDRDTGSSKGLRLSNDDAG
jgi:RNA recognition motif-containing protein